MDSKHDPFIQASYIRQSLAQDKRPLGLFLGAGCPSAITEDGNPLIPDIKGITKIVCDKLSKSEFKEYFKNVCTNLKTDGKDDPNIEEILSFTRSLQSVAGKNETVRGLKGAELENIDKSICDTIYEIVNKTLTKQDSPFHKVASWVGSRNRTEPVEIFTTNYDLLMEQALEEKRVPYFDGFIGSKCTFFDPHAMEEDTLPSRWVRLWKLHGSINWRQDKAGAVSRGEKFSPDTQKRVIHPSHLKYEESRRMPYLAMIDRLHAFLKKPSAVLIICGYSFGDDHLNEVLIQGLQGNPTAVAFALMYGKLDVYDKAIKLAISRTNLSLLAKDAAVVGSKKGIWIEKELIENSESIAVEWIEKITGGKEESLKTPSFKLGDFSCFGSFIEDLIGEYEESTEIDKRKT